MGLRQVAKWLGDTECASVRLKKRLGSTDCTSDKLARAREALNWPEAGWKAPGRH